MAIQLTDNIKFLAGFLVYIVYASWWASGISATVGYNAKHAEETLIVLKDHMEECSEMHKTVASISKQVDINSKDIKQLQNILFIPIDLKKDK
jgi:hypothetical protein